MDGSRRPALLADEFDKGIGVEKPLILLVDKTSECMMFVDGFNALQFDLQIVESVEDAWEIVYREHSRNIAALVNIGIEVSGSIALVTSLSKDFGNRVIPVGLKKDLKPDEELGAMKFGAKRVFDKGLVSNKEARLVEIIAEFVSNKGTWRTMRDSRTDPLTGLDNTRSFRQSMLGQLNSSLRRDNPQAVSVIAFDGDGLKKINDSHGHEAGSESLRLIANAMRVTRPSDHHCRMGGDEFLLGVADEDKGEVEKIANRIRNHVADNALKSPRGWFHVSVSFGVSHIGHEEVKVIGEEPSLRKLLTEADEELYVMKNKGKDSE